MTVRVVDSESLRINHWVWVIQNEHSLYTFLITRTSLVFFCNVQRERKCSHCCSNLLCFLLFQYTSDYIVLLVRLLLLLSTVHDIRVHWQKVMCVSNEDTDYLVFSYNLIRDFAAHITKSCLYIFDPDFYRVKLGFTGVYVIFLISAQKHRLWVLVRTASSRRF